MMPFHRKAYNVIRSLPAAASNPRLSLAPFAIHSISATSWLRLVTSSLRKMP
jgi:hypothetical protein